MIFLVPLFSQAQSETPTTEKLDSTANKDVASPLPGERSQLRLTTKNESHTTTFDIGAELISATMEGRSIMGFGPKGGLEFAVGDRISLGAAVTFAFQATGQPGSYFYSGFAGALRYNLTGSNSKDRITIQDNNRVIVETHRIYRPRWAIGCGVEQLLLSGTQNVFPAVGGFAMTSLSYRLFGFDFESAIKTSFLQASNKPLLAIAIGTAAILDF